MRDALAEAVDYGPEAWGWAYAITALQLEGAMPDIVMKFIVNCGFKGCASVTISVASVGSSAAPSTPILTHIDSSRPCLADPISAPIIATGA